MSAEEDAFVEAVRDANPGDDWTVINLDICGNIGTLGITPSWDSSAPGPKIKARGSMALEAIREATADPQRGAWLTAQVTIPKTGTATFTYDWMTQPTWAAIGGLDNALYLDDLKAFPRTPENIPDWYPKPGLYA
ncbi:hypothetical protein ACPCIR_02115 [Mycobacterium sp. NPDC051198]